MDLFRAARPGPAAADHSVLPRTNPVQAASPILSTAAVARPHPLRTAPTPSAQGAPQIDLFTASRPRNQHDALQHAALRHAQPVHPAAPVVQPQRQVFEPAATLASAFGVTLREVHRERKTSRQYVSEKRTHKPMRSGRPATFAKLFLVTVGEVLAQLEKKCRRCTKDCSRSF